jgi:hypothetical protein
MTEKRKRTTTVVCTDEVWSGFQALAAERGTTCGVLLGDVVDDAVAGGWSNDQATLPDTSSDGGTAVPRHAIPARTLIGFGRPVIRIR